MEDAPAGISGYYFTMSYRLACLVSAALIAAVQVASAQDRPASTSNVTTEREESQSEDSEELIYVFNRSSHTIIVTSVRLTECENIQGNCGARRMKERIRPGQRVVVQRVRVRSPNFPSTFGYSFTWEQEAVEGPTAKDVEKDKTALEVDTVIVLPKLFDIKVGETIDLTQILRIKAMNAARQDLPHIWFYTEIVLGEDVISLEGSKLTGKAAGTGALLVSASTVQGPKAPTKGASRILIQVTP